MRKIYAVLASLSLIFLLGCSFDKEELIKDEQISEKPNIQEISSEEIKNEQNSDIYKYEELKKVSEIINLEEYNTNIQSDNEGTRVIIFEKDGRKMYKSIFVKENRHLKLINLELNEKPLINETI